MGLMDDLYQQLDAYFERKAMATPSKLLDWKHEVTLKACSSILMNQSKNSKLISDLINGAKFDKIHERK